MNCFPQFGLRQLPAERIGTDWCGRHRYNADRRWNRNLGNRRISRQNAKGMTVDAIGPSAYTAIVCGQKRL